MDQKIQSITQALKDLTEDTTVPKNIRNRVLNIIQILQDDSDLNIKINRALQELDEISEDTNIQQYTRTQVWNIASMLEMLN
ncbi:hypothetical protein HN587_05100 [Candidatus Woesearchaeota archaeon]|jgi:uncharacterized protein|nr:hypothetical protein [Candidatus Woesearchaeota archaeon]